MPLLTSAIYTDSCFNCLNLNRSGKYTNVFYALLFALSVQYVNERFHLRNLILVVENNGFEPLTPCLQSRCSSQLS